MRKDSDILPVPSSCREISGVGLKGVEKGWVEGEVLFIDRPVSFLGDVDPERGTIKIGGAVLEIKDRILVFPEGAGSTVGSYVIYNLRLNGTAPSGIVMNKADAIITIGCIVASIPLVHRIGMDDLRRIGEAERAWMNTSRGIVRVGPVKDGR